MFSPRQEDYEDFYPEEFTPLMFAVFKGYEQCVNDLIEAGADVNQTDSNGHTAVMLAASGGFVNCVKKLIEAGADVNLTLEEDNDTSAALIGAAIGSQLINSNVQTPRANEISGGYNGNPCANGHELRANVNNNAEKIHLSKSKPLRERHLIDHVTCVKLIVEAGADVNVVATVLAATSSGNCKWLETLLKAVAEVNIGKKGSWALIHTVEIDKETCEETIEELDDLYKKGYHNHNRYLELLLEAGADVNDKDDVGNTALIYTALNNYNQCAKTLLKAGADVNMCNNDGETALIAASKNDHSECVKILFEAGADVNMCSKDGETALMVASENGHNQ